MRQFMSERQAFSCEISRAARYLGALVNDCGTRWRASLHAEARSGRVDAEGAVLDVSGSSARASYGVSERGRRRCIAMFTLCFAASLSRSTVARSLLVHGRFLLGSR